MTCEILRPDKPRWHHAFFLIWETLSFNSIYVAACYPVGTVTSKTSSLFTALLQHYIWVNRTFCKHSETVKILIRHRIMQGLIWVCTVCLCTIKTLCFLYTIFSLIIGYINFVTKSVRRPSVCPSVRLSMRPCVRHVSCKCIFLLNR